ncbi:MAG: hypothetical protein LBV44_07215 [Methylobacillus sp.]|jgi:type IV secretory pathway VirB10-like protein|nr:hypothetical protein [Methylobacillus sp.]
MSKSKIIAALIVGMFAASVTAPVFAQGTRTEDRATQRNDSPQPAHRADNAPAAQRDNQARPEKPDAPARKDHERKDRKDRKDHDRKDRKDRKDDHRDNRDGNKNDHRDNGKNDRKDDHRDNRNGDKNDHRDNGKNDRKDDRRDDRGDRH